MWQCLGAVLILELMDGSDSSPAHPYIGRDSETNLSWRHPYRAWNKTILPLAPLMEQHEKSQDTTLAARVLVRGAANDTGAVFDRFSWCYWCLLIRMLFLVMDLELMEEFRRQS